MANRVDPDQILYSVASDLGLHFAQACPSQQEIFLQTFFWPNFIFYFIYLFIFFTYFCMYVSLTFLLLNTTCPVLANSVDPDQLASEEANWSGSALFVIKYVNFYQKPGLSNLIGWKLEVSVAS